MMVASWSISSNFLISSCFDVCAELSRNVAKVASFIINNCFGVKLSTSSPFVSMWKTSLWMCEIQFGSSDSISLSSSVEYATGKYGQMLLNML